MKNMLMKTHCAFCGKKNCHNECRTPTDERITDARIARYDIEDFQYLLRKANDAIHELSEKLNESLEHQLTIEKGLLKKKRTKKVL